MSGGFLLRIFQGCNLEGRSPRNTMGQLEVGDDGDTDGDDGDNDDNDGHTDGDTDGHNINTQLHFLQFTTTHT